MCSATQADITAFRAGDIVKLADAVESEVAVVAGIAACRLLHLYLQSEFVADGELAQIKPML